MMLTPSKLSTRMGSDGKMHRYYKGSNALYSPVERARAQYKVDYTDQVDPTKRGHVAPLSCPQGFHVSYRTPSGMLRASPICRPGSAASMVPNLYTSEAGPFYKYGSRCKNGYSRNSRGNCTRAASKSKKSKKSKKAKKRRSRR